MYGSAAGPWGNWTNPVYCPPGSFATGYEIRVLSPRGMKDDSAADAIKLYCEGLAFTGAALIKPHDGYWGNWYGATCPRQTDVTRSFLTGYQSRVEGHQGSGDDTAMNAVRMRCGDGSDLLPHGGYWGAWGVWKHCLAGTAIAGLRVKFEKNQGSSGYIGIYTGKNNDTALNDVEFYCRVLPTSPVGQAWEWTPVPGLATDISVGADGSVWVIGADGRTIYYWTGSSWQKVEGVAVNISVNPSGKPWIISDGGSISVSTQSAPSNI